MSGISLSISIVFVFAAAFVARLVILGILFLISVAFLFSTSVVINPATIGVSFSISVIFVLQSVILTNPLVLVVFLSTSSTFFSRPCLSESYCILMTDPGLLGIFVSVALSLITNMSYRVFLTPSLSTTLLVSIKLAGTILNVSTSKLSFQASQICI